MGVGMKLPGGRRRVGAGTSRQQVQFPTHSHGAGQTHQHTNVIDHSHDEAGAATRPAPDVVVEGFAVVLGRHFQAVPTSLIRQAAQTAARLIAGEDEGGEAEGERSLVRVAVTSAGHGIEVSWHGSAPPPGEVASVLTSAVGATLAAAECEAPAGRHGPAPASTAGPVGSSAGTPPEDRSTSLGHW